MKVSRSHLRSAPSGLAALTCAALGLASLGAPCASAAAAPASRRPAPVAAPATSRAPVAAPATSPAAAPATPAVAAPVRPMGEGVAAVVNDDVISTYDLRQRIRLLIISTGVQPTEQNLPEIEREALRGLVDERLQLQEIRNVQKRQKDVKLLPADKELDAEVADYAKQFNMNAKQLVSSLKAAGVDEQTLRDQIGTSIAWRRYIGSRFRDNVHIGDDQVNAALARIDASAAKPQYLLSEVYLDPARVGGQKAALDGATQLVNQIRQGAPFSAVARQFSALPSAANGGDAGWLVSGQMDPVLETAAAALKPGDVSEPVVTADGVYILQLRDRRAGANAIVVNLKQAAIAVKPDAPADEVTADQAKLAALKAQVSDCDQLAPAAAKASGVVAGDLGDVNPQDLSPEFQQAIAPLKVGEIGGPVRTRSGLHLLQLCARHAGGGAAPSRSDIENRLYSEQISMIERRFMRDLRNSAAIENR